jgi:hypothetical protein
MAGLSIGRTAASPRDGQGYCANGKARGHSSILTHPRLGYCARGDSQNPDTSRQYENAVEWRKAANLIVSPLGPLGTTNSPPVALG